MIAEPQDFRASKTREGIWHAVPPSAFQRTLPRGPDPEKHRFRPFLDRPGHFRLFSNHVQSSRYRAISVRFQIVFHGFCTFFQNFLSVNRSTVTHRSIYRSYQSGSRRGLLELWSLAARKVPDQTSIVLELIRRMVPFSTCHLHSNLTILAISSTFDIQ